MKNHDIIDCKNKMYNYNVMIDEQDFFDKPVKSNLKIYESIQKMAKGQGDDYTFIIISKTNIR